MRILKREEIEKHINKSHYKNKKEISENNNSGIEMIQFDLITHKENIQQNAEQTNPDNSKSTLKVITVVSGKGGVGKSTISALIALKLSSLGYDVGLLDADITAPNLLFMFRSTQQMKPHELIEPVHINPHLKLASVGALTSRFDKPILLIGKTKVEIINQFVNTVNWGHLDYLIIDTPPGTSDEILTIFSLFKHAKYVIVTTPRLTDLQDALRMKNLLNLYNFSILGMVINSSYVTCPKCGKKIYLGNQDDLKSLDTNILFEIPFDPSTNGDVNKIFEKYSSLINEEVLQ